LSDNYPRHLEALLGKLGCPNAHGRVFGHLILRALLSRLSGTNQLDAAQRVLRNIDLDQTVESGKIPIESIDFEHVSTLTIGWDAISLITSTTV